MPVARINVYDVPENIHETFKKVADKNHRSVTRQVLYMIEVAVAEFTVNERAAEQARNEATERAWREAAK